ncbi:MAG: hypothetical protein ISR48_01395 [Alphaproteobacteria bacterium]|nr:hypothetical protein [Alphaproteobacteria bacterium]
MTLFCLTLAALLGFGLFKIKHEVQILEEELTQLHRAILTDQESIHVLNAEWSYLNRPRHLQKLNIKFLGFMPVSAERITSIEKLPLRNDPASSAKIADENEGLEQDQTSPPPHDIRQVLLRVPQDAPPLPQPGASGNAP